MFFGLTSICHHKPSSSSWMNVTPNPKVFQLMCNWNGHPYKGHLKMKIGMNLAFNY